MKLLFAGTPDISAHILSGLIAFAQNHPHEILAVLTQPDRPSGRGKHVIKSPVKQFAETAHLPVLQPHSLSAKKDPLIQETLKSLKPDLLIVMAYGLILPQAVLDIPRYGCWNIHVSLLPKWRGAAPIQRAIEAGDTESGVCLMQMDAGLDTGDILGQETCPILLSDTAETVHLRLADLGLTLLKEKLTSLELHRNLPRQPQNHELATYAHKIEKSEGQIDWSQPMLSIHHKIMAFNPWPVCFSALENTIIRCWTSQPTDFSHSGKPGTLVVFDHHRLGVVSGDHKILELLTLQFPGKRVMSARDILNGHGESLVGRTFTPQIK